MTMAEKSARCAERRAAIKAMWDDGVMIREIAAAFGMTENAISKISGKYGWKRRCKGPVSRERSTVAESIMRADMADALAMRSEGRTDGVIAEWLGWTVAEVRERLAAVTRPVAAVPAAGLASDARAVSASFLASDTRALPADAPSLRLVHSTSSTDRSSISSASRNLGSVPGGSDHEGLRCAGLHG